MQYGFKNTLALARRVKLAQRKEKSQLNAGFENKLSGVIPIQSSLVVCQRYRKRREKYHQFR